MGVDVPTDDITKSEIGQRQYENHAIDRDMAADVSTAAYESAFDAAIDPRFLQEETLTGTVGDQEGATQANPNRDYSGQSTIHRSSHNGPHFNEGDQDTLASTDRPRDQVAPRKLNPFAGHIVDHDLKVVHDFLGPKTALPPVLQPVEEQYIRVKGKLRPALAKYPIEIPGPDAHDDNAARSFLPPQATSSSSNAFAAARSRARTAQETLHNACAGLSKPVDARPGTEALLAQNETAQTVFDFTRAQHTQHPSSSSRAPCPPHGLSPANMPESFQTHSQQQQHWDQVLSKPDFGFDERQLDYVDPQNLYEPGVPASHSSHAKTDQPWLDPGLQDPWQDEGPVYDMPVPPPDAAQPVHWPHAQTPLDSGILFTGAHEELESVAYASPAPVNRETGRNRTACAAQCGKNFEYEKAQDPGKRYCNRCWKKEKKKPDYITTEPYIYYAKISSYAEAHSELYPELEPLANRFSGPVGDDFKEYMHPAAEDEWVKIFIHAANTTYEDVSQIPEALREYLKLGDDSTELDKLHEHFLAQQKTYKEKPFNDSSQDWYDNKWVNIRMRFLFTAIIRVHAGGPSLYPKGGDNRGYTTDKTLKCSERLERVREILEYDKRTLIDVVEGRGVLGFVENPKQYHARKLSNFRCNNRKKEKLDAMALIEADKSRETPGIGEDDVDSFTNTQSNGVGTGRGRKRKTGPAAQKEPKPKMQRVRRNESRITQSPSTRRVDLLASDNIDPALLFATAGEDTPTQASYTHEQAVNAAHASRRSRSTSLRDQKVMPDFDENGLQS